MKKIVILMMAALALSACGSNEETKVTEEVKVSEKKESKKEEVYFKDDVAKTEEAKVEITEMKVIQVGEEGNEYGDKPVFAVWYKATNLTDKEMTPIDAWIDNFSAIQDNDPNMVNKLGIGGSPDYAHLDTQLNVIKKDGTVEGSTAYELDDLETPVTLIVTNGFFGDEIGEVDYEIK